MVHTNVVCVFCVLFEITTPIAFSLCRDRSMIPFIFILSKWNACMYDMKSVPLHPAVSMYKFNDKARLELTKTQRFFEH